MFTLKITPTLINLNGGQSYLASSRVEGVFAPITAIATSHRDALAAVLPKIEAAMAAKERRDVVRISVECACC